MLLSLGRYLCWWIICPRWYHQPSSLCFYHCVDTSASGLFFPDGIINPVVSAFITGSIPLLVDYLSPTVSSTQSSVLLSLGRYLCWWIICSRGYNPPSSQCFYHWVDTSAGGFFVPDGIIHPVVSASITGSIPLLVDYLFHDGIIHPVVSASITGSIPLLVDYLSPMVSSTQ